ncbi:SWIM zinc finger family protein [Paenibacillus arenilitoris]|uniref:SWIM zinc finger family protein n=1 Tax=Paenibacillus arenilitoris TaxID=2772299 RepID=A0A927CRD1_9BACL|nr:SWIM zinc finger family protein [Paenibacillus arenilitoris]MBD2870521.1 SWIM zinc finger family protein [Paenibacillus arenilitoris]
MNIYHFKDQIDRTILARGYEYYTDGYVIEVSAHGDNCYTILVEGSELYEVEVRLDGSGRIVHSECDCPYDYGPVCKHEAAAYYELLDILDSDSELVQGKAVKQPDLKEVLTALPKERLIEIIAEIARQNTVLRNQLLLTYSQDGDDRELDKCKRLIASIVNKYTGREGLSATGKRDVLQTR